MANEERSLKRLAKKKEKLLKPHNVVNVAIARELAGFVWAVMQHESVPESA